MAKALLKKIGGGMSFRPVQTIYSFYISLSYHVMIVDITCYDNDTMIVDRKQIKNLFNKVIS